MDKVEVLKKQIRELPAGNISRKKINGKVYPYLQWTESGKQRSRIVHADELKALSEQVNLRKDLERKLKSLERTTKDPVRGETFHAYVLRDDELREFARPTRTWAKREAYDRLRDYVEGGATDRVFVLYGLRRTGKTTLIRQVIGDMSDEVLSKTAFLQVSERVTLNELNSDLRTLVAEGRRWFFIDEVTLLADFVEGAALFSDVYATRGIKIVLSGTDSLGFLFSQDRELYDRAVMEHTTFVPYREFERVLGIKGIDEYIRYGGTMSKGGVNYNHSRMTFATNKSTNEYIDSAIAHNIQHSLKTYQDGTHFRNLAGLYEAGELTSAINRIVEDMNHRWTLDVLTRDFRSSDLSLSARNLLKDRDKPNDILYRVNAQAITDGLKKLLDVKNKSEMKVTLTDVHRHEIKEYLDLLDLTYDIDVVSLSDLSHREKKVIVTQPGLRYAQAEALISALMADATFAKCPLGERNEIKSRIMSDIMGRMLEDIVLLEAAHAHPDHHVFKLVFDVGEFDMVIFDEKTASCEIYEVKHSSKSVKTQCRHLLDAKKCAATEHAFGPIKHKSVLYLGKSKEAFGVDYVNVEDWLKQSCHVQK